MGMRGGRRGGVCGERGRRVCEEGGCVRGGEGVYGERVGCVLEKGRVCEAGGCVGRRVCKGRGGVCVENGEGVWGGRVCKGRGGVCVEKGEGVWGGRVCKGRGGVCVEKGEGV